MKHIPDSAATANACHALERYLQDRASALSDDIRHYPTPIARCDEQLTALIEQRGESQRRLKLVRSALARQSPGSIELDCRTVRQILASYPSSQDATEEALLSQVRVAVE